MTKSIDYYLSLRSPWAYLGSQVLEEIAARHGATVAVKPVDYGTIFPQTGGLPLPKRAPERQAYRLVELRRWRARRELPLNLEPIGFAVDEGPAARLVIAARDSGGDPLRLAHAVLRAVWVEERRIDEPETLKAIADETGHDGGALLALAERPEAAAAYEALTREALSRGVFGAPTYIYRDEPFWGQDRLDFLDRALAES